jgi:hypothetical protein
MTRESSSDEKSKKSTRFLGNRAVSILQKWFNNNKEYPYPDDANTDKLAREASMYNKLQLFVLFTLIIISTFYFKIDISCKQVKKWFANKRVRSQMCCKPIHRSINKKVNKTQ